MLNFGWPTDLTWYKLLTDWGSLIGGGFALIAGAALYFIGRLQVKATSEAADKEIAATRDAISAAQEQTRVAQEQSRAQLRAYVFVSRAVVTDVDHGTGMPEAQVTIKNSGQTPAHDVINVSGFAFDRYPSPPTLDLIISDGEFSAPARTREVLGPGDTSISVTSAGRLLTAQEKASLASGTHIIYVYGEIRYTDAFGREQRTKYRLMMGGPVGVRGGQLAGCEVGNEAT